MTNEADLRNEVRGYAGYRVGRKVRTTGTVVVLLSNEEGAVDGDAGNPWVTMCATHNRFVTHQTQAIALAFLSYPETWCEVCNGTEAAD